MGKPTICIGENKSTDQLRSNCEADQRPFFFATRIVQFLFYLNSKFQASSFFLCLYRSVCVGPVRKPHCWFSHEVAHILSLFQDMYIYLSEFMDYNAFEEKDLFWSKKGLMYGDWESGPNKDGTFTFEGSVQASEVSTCCKYYFM